MTVARKLEKYEHKSINNNNNNNNNKHGWITNSFFRKYEEDGEQHKVTVRHSAEIAALYQLSGVTGSQLLEKFPQYSKASIYRHAKRLIGLDAPTDKRRHNKGRPSKLTPHDC